MAQRGGQITPAKRGIEDADETKAPIPDKQPEVKQEAKGQPPLDLQGAKWVSALINSKHFFQPCVKCKANLKSQSESFKTVVNLVCLNCAEETGVCQLCMHEHEGHFILQIRRSSYHDVVRVQELSKLLNTEGIQTYVINSSRVVFLRERPQNRGKSAVLGGAGQGCVQCSRNLHEGMLYCSLGCKVKHCCEGGELGDRLPPALVLSKASTSGFSPVTPQLRRVKRKLSAGRSPSKSPPPSEAKPVVTHRRKSCPKRSPWK